MAVEIEHKSRGPDAVGVLIREGRENGKNVFVGSILECFPGATVDQLDKVFSRIEDAGLEIVESQKSVDRRKFDSIEVDDLTGLYLSESSETPLLRAEEEVSLGKKIEAGKAARKTLDEGSHLSGSEKRKLKAVAKEGQAALKHLARANTRLVTSFAKKYRGKGVNYLDLIQQGNIGLMKAADKFDYRIGRFSTYATWWIRNEVTRLIAYQSRPFPIYSHTWDQMQKIYRIKYFLEGKFKREVSNEEIATEMKISPEKVGFLFRISQHVLSLDEPAQNDEGDENTLGHFIPDETSPSPPEEVERKLFGEDISDLLKVLTPLQRKIIRMRFGLDGRGEQTLSKIGRHFGISGEMIRRIKVKALDKMLEEAKKRGLEDFLEG